MQVCEKLLPALFVMYLQRFPVSGDTDSQDHPTVAVQHKLGDTDQFCGNIKTHYILHQYNNTARLIKQNMNNYDPKHCKWEQLKFCKTYDHNKQTCK